MYRYFFVFLWSSVAVGLSGILLIFTYLTNNEFDYVYLFKVPLGVMFLTMACFHLNYRIRLKFPIVLFLIFGFCAFCIGLFRETLLSKASVIHAYFTVTPLLAISFGYYFAKSYKYKSSRLIRKVVKATFVTSFITLLIYYYHYYISGKIAYFGFGSDLPIVGAMALSHKYYARYLGLLILILLSGKRSTLINTLSPLFLIGASYAKLFNPKRVLVFLFGLALLVGLGYGFYRLNMMSRFVYFFSLDLKNNRDLYIATSGRSDEIMGIIKHMNQEPIRWLFGSGWGGEYIVTSSWYLDELPYPKHYAHLSILTYIFIFGAPFTFAIFGFIFYIFWRNRLLINNFYYLSMICLFMGSVFGALMMVDPLFWFFLGVNIFISENRKSSALINTL